MENSLKFSVAVINFTAHLSMVSYKHTACLLQLPFGIRYAIDNFVHYRYAIEL